MSLGSSPVGLKRLSRSHLKSSLHRHVQNIDQKREEALTEHFSLTCSNLPSAVCLAGVPQNRCRSYQHSFYVGILHFNNPQVSIKTLFPIPQMAGRLDSRICFLQTAIDSFFSMCQIQQEFLIIFLNYIMTRKKNNK